MLALPELALDPVAMRSGPCEVTLASVVAVLRGLRVHALRSEYALHAAIAAALTEAGLPFAREVRLAPGARIDFTVGDTASPDTPVVGVEVKKGKPNSTALRAQAERYAGSMTHPERVGIPLRGLVLVSERSVAMLPARWTTAAGLPVEVLSLSKQWGIAL